jgi:Domain of unknown function (DUF385).
MMTRVRPVFDVRVARSLEHGRLVEITTRGRQTGQLRRIELAFHNIGGRIYLSGRPGKRGWYANLVADPRFTFHLTDGVVADLPATARPVTDLAERRRLLSVIAASWGYDLDLMVASAPLVEVTFEAGVR